MKTTAASVLAALLSFVIGTVWIFVSADMFVQYFYETRMVALAHVFTLGWVSLMIIGVLRQLGPVAFGLKLSWTPIIGVGVGVWIPAMVAMILGFATRHYGLAAIATSLLFVAVMSITAAFLLSFRAVHLEMPHGHLFAALLYFDAAALLGAWMGLAKGWDMPLPAAFHHVLFAHIHLAGAGWAGMMVLAVMSRLFPQPHLRHPLQARIRFMTFHLGLVGLTASLLSRATWAPYFGIILAIGCIWYALVFIPVLQEFWQPSDRSTTFLIASWCCLAVVSLLGLWFALATLPSNFLVRLQFVYGFVYLFGWLSFMIIGMLYRIIPTHVSKYLTLHNAALPGGIRRRGLMNRHLQTVVWLAMLSGLVVSTGGILTGRVQLFRFGWSLWIVGILLFFSGLCRLGMEIRTILRTTARLS